VKLAGAPVRYKAVDGVGWISLTRPQVLNALDAQLAADLAAAVAAAEAEPDARVVVVTGEGRAFSSGMDRRAPGLAVLPHLGLGGGGRDSLRRPRATRSRPAHLSRAERRRPRRLLRKPERYLPWRCAPAPGSTMPTRHAQTLVAWGCGGLGEEETERMVSMDLAIDAEGWHAFLRMIRLR
jgi:Enoyl-CoA hydratase/isomerase